MYLCFSNPQLLNHDLAVRLMQRQSGKVDNGRDAALIRLFKGYPYKTDYNSNGFKLLWENEKYINIYVLKTQLRSKLKL